MARLARVVIHRMPRHVAQRGNRRQQTFFSDGDYAAYLEQMADWCREERAAIWACCLMLNHAHLIAALETEQALRCAVGGVRRCHAPLAKPAERHCRGLHLNRGDEVDHRPFIIKCVIVRPDPICFAAPGPFQAADMAISYHFLLWPLRNK